MSGEPLRTELSPTAYLIVAGNVAAGKTTTLQQLELLDEGCQVLPEHPEAIFGRYCAAPERHAFVTQLAFMVQYLEAGIAASKLPGLIAQERWIGDAAAVFGSLRRERGWITREEQAVLNRLEAAVVRLRSPTHVVLLDAPPGELRLRLDRREAIGDAGLTELDLAELRRRYDAWFSGLSLRHTLRIRTDTSAPADIAQRILDWLRGTTGYRDV